MADLIIVVTDRHVDNYRLKVQFDGLRVITITVRQFLLVLKKSFVTFNQTLMYPYLHMSLVCINCRCNESSLDLTGYV